MAPKFASTTVLDQPRDDIGQFGEKHQSHPETGLPDASNRHVESDAAKALAYVESGARRFAARYRMDEYTRDDITQDTILDLLVQQKTKGLATLSHDNALLNAAVRSVSQRYIDPNVHHYALKARKLLKLAAGAEQQKLGRVLTFGEYKALADDIRMNAFKPGQRPTDDFYIENREMSIDRPLGDENGSTFADILVDDAPTRLYGHDNSRIGDLVDGLELGAKDKYVGDHEDVERKSKTEVKKDLWDTLADVHDAPKVARGSVLKANAAETRKKVDGYDGGIEQLARDWQNGDTSASDDKALFAPFGDLSMPEQDRVVDQLLRHPEYAGDLWNTALTAATAGRK